MVALAAVAGCSQQQPSVTPTPSAGPASAPASAAAVTGMAQFVAAVQRSLPEVAIDRRDDEISDLGQQACTRLASGAKPATVADELHQFGLSDTDARGLVTLAKSNVCHS